MMRSIHNFISICLLICAFASSEPAAVVKQKMIKVDGSAKWSRVVGGSSASKGQFPYMASIRYHNEHHCGASIITSLHLLTAAHCTKSFSPEDIYVVVGSTTLNSGGTVYNISSIINYPNYNSSGRNDISILKTASPILQTNTVGPIGIGSASLGAGVTVTVSGWGRTSTHGDTPNDLQFINLKTINNTECAERLSDTTILDSHLCTFTRKGEGICFGDSGGPLAADGSLVGITSRAVPCAAGYPDIFTRVSSFVDWIEENTII